MEITLTDVDGIRFQVAVLLIREFFRRGNHTELTLYDGKKFNVTEEPAVIYKKIMEAQNVH